MSEDYLLMMSILMPQPLSPFTFVPPPLPEATVAHSVAAKPKPKAANRQ